ncbi:MAG: glycerol-3-phosphate dehydrogenase [Nitrococcus sp.]|nr:glycerol-3-phosphate dehydrogenase [Nitrococcus sp.]
MSEGGLQAPMRHPLDWQDPDFYDRNKLQAEERRVFDVCHGCRRCFNLCDAFPRLFDLIDESETGEVESVPSQAFQQVADACTLCDMCFMSKCPYVPPHELNIDFPHLMLRHRCVDEREQRHSMADHALSRTDRNGRLAAPLAPLVNWTTRTDNRLTRALLEKTVHIHKSAQLPKYHRRTFLHQAQDNPPALNTQAPAYGRRAVLYATCFVNYNNPAIGRAARAVLAKNGVDTSVVYPGCCGMPRLEQGELEAVAEAATTIARELCAWTENGYQIIALIPSCALMIKFEWPLIAKSDPAVQKLARSTMDISEYIMDIARNEGLADGLQPLPGGIMVHLACHARAQNMGAKAAEMLRLLPDSDVSVIERCSGHGGVWGVERDNFDVALKVGRPVARRVATEGKRWLASECPLAGVHIAQGIERLAAEDGRSAAIEPARHPIELLARAYGLEI